MKTTRFLSHQTLILACLLYATTTTPNAWGSPVGTNPVSAYVSKSCSATLYPKLCNKTLSKHAERIKSSPKLLAMAALVATFNATQTTSRVLRYLRPGEGPHFFLQMDDVRTWVSAALTDDDTCMDGFTTSGRIKTLVRGFVLTIARLTSISLTFINNYAAL